MNLRNKTDKELKDMLDKLSKAMGTHAQADNIIIEPLIDSKYEVHKEIIRRERRGKCERNQYQKLIM